MWFIPIALSAGLVYLLTRPKVVPKAPPIPNSVGISWVQSKNANSYPVKMGGRYAGLASASKNFTIQQITDYLNGHGWQVTYAWEYGTDSRGGEFNVDVWLMGLKADSTDNHRWIWIEGNRTGKDDSVSASPPWPLTLYYAGPVFQAP